MSERFLIYPFRNGRSLSHIFFGVSLFLLSGLSGGTRAASPVSGAPIEEKIRRGLVRLRISTVAYSHVEPWSQKPGGVRNVLGLVVSGNRVIVAGGNIRNAGLVEVTSYNAYTPRIATVERVDMEANLALLKIDDDSFFQELQPLDLGSDSRPGDSLNAVRMDTRFRVYREKTTILETETAADYGFTHVPVQVFRTDENYSEGGILMKDGTVVGFVQYADSGKKNEAFPASVLKSFLEKEYSGFVSQGFAYHELVDPVYREYLGLDGEGPGVHVGKVLPGTSAWGVLQEGDVLLSVDGIQVDPRGYYEDPALGRQTLRLLLARNPDGEVRRPGQVTSLEVFRNGKKMKVSMPLRAYQGVAERIPWLVDGRPGFRIVNGMVFQELTVPYLQEAFGSSWQKRVIEYSYLFNTDRYYKIPADDTIVIMSRVFPDDLNREDERLSGEILKSVDGRPVRNLRHFREIIDGARKAGKEIVEIEMIDQNRLYLDLTTTDARERNILLRYGVTPVLDSSELQERDREASNL